MAVTSKSKSKSPAAVESAPVVSETEPAPQALAVSSTATTAVTVAEVDDNDFGEMSGAAETITKDDLLILRYRLVQPLTKAKKGSKTIIDGHFYNTLTKVGQAEGIVVPITEEHLIVERVADDKGKFLGTLSIQDDRVKKARKANGDSLIKLQSIDRDPPTKFIETRNVHVAFLDPRDGVTFRGFGVLQFEGANLTPGKVWKNERASACAPVIGADGKPGKARPSFAFRTIVRGDGIKDNSGIDKADSALWVIRPYGAPAGADETAVPAENWDTGMLRMSNPVEKALLLKLFEHKKLLDSGALKVDYRDEEAEEASETSAEDASFDPDDDGREPSADGSSFDD